MDKILKYDYLKDNALKMASEGYSCHTIARFYNVDHRAVWRLLKRNDVTISRSDVNRRYTINHQAFDELTNESSYWLGCFVGDGSVVGNERAGSICLHGHIDDIDHGMLFRDFLGSNAPVYKHPTKKAYAIKVASSRLMKRLNTLNIHQNKTHTVTYPYFLSDELHSHFIRGLMDTDGCVQIRYRKRYVTPQAVVSFTGNQFIIPQVAEIITRYTGLTPTGLRNASKHSPTTRTLSYEGRKKQVVLFKWLYKDSSNITRLHRKYDKLHTLLLDDL